MIESKVLVSLNVPVLEQRYDVYFPVNRKIHNVIKMLKSSLFDLSNGLFKVDQNYVLYNKENGMPYDMNKLVRDTDIRNGSMIIMLWGGETQ